MMQNAVGRSKIIKFIVPVNKNLWTNMLRLSLVEIFASCYMSDYLNYGSHHCQTLETFELQNTLQRPWSMDFIVLMEEIYTLSMVGLRTKFFCLETLDKYLEIIFDNSVGPYIMTGVGTNDFVV